MDTNFNIDGYILVDSKVINSFTDYFEANLKNLIFKFYIKDKQCKYLSKINKRDHNNISTFFIKIYHHDNIIYGVEEPTAIGVYEGFMYYFTINGLYFNKKNRTLFFNLYKKHYSIN